MQMELSIELPADPTRIERRFKAIRVRQPIGDIYVASVDHRTIQEITYFDVRRRLQERRDVEMYLGIQRPLNEIRVRELNEYVNFIDATFPSSVIVSVENDYAYFDESSSEIVISNTKTDEDIPSIPIRYAARVIDGQHRIRGLEKFDTSKGGHFEVMVSFFIGSDISDQAYVFATVNLEQTKVNKSLAYDLFELARSRSPFKTCHNVAVALDLVETSPFYRKIKRLGVSDGERTNIEGYAVGAMETLTQATFVNGLVQYISDEPKSDRDAILRGKKLTPPTTDELNRLVFRELFISGDDKSIGKIYEAYFQAVKEKWPEAWDYRGTGIVLSRTNGYRALSSIFGKIYRAVAAPGDIVYSGAFRRMFDMVDVDWDYFNTTNFKPGSSGESELKRLFLVKMGLSN